MTKAKNPIQSLDPSKLRIVDEPYKDGRASPVSKYEPIFSVVKPNQRIVCPAGSAAHLRPHLPRLRQDAGAAGHGNRGVPHTYVAISTDGGRKRYELRHVGKKAAGRLLDGREWNGAPAC